MRLTLGKVSENTNMPRIRPCKTFYLGLSKKCDYSSHIFYLFYFLIK